MVGAWNNYALGFDLHVLLCLAYYNIMYGVNLFLGIMDCNNGGKSLCILDMPSEQ